MYTTQKAAPNRFLTLIVVLALSMGLTSLAEARQADVPLRAPLTDYEGSFEGREILIENGDLTYYRRGMPNAISLERLGQDHFGIVIPLGAVVQTRDDHPIPTFKFERNEAGAVVKLVILDPDGKVMSEHPKTDELGASSEANGVH